ncbi:MAG: adenosylcobinamide amidohydrolase [Acidimicrobiales bacterium]
MNRPRLTSRVEEGRRLDLLYWPLARSMRVAATAASGGGVGPRDWILNAQVPSGYGRVDVTAHVRELATSLGLAGDGVGLLTAAAVRGVRHATDEGVDAHVTVGLARPTWAAAPDGDGDDESAAGTINIVVFVPAALSDAALCNALTTATEAKCQALFDEGVAGTGTASDAVCVVSPGDGDGDVFAGPRSRWGSRLARCVYAAVRDGARRHPQ